MDSVLSVLLQVLSPLFSPRSSLEMIPRILDGDLGGVGEVSANTFEPRHGPRSAQAPFDRKLE